MKLIFRYLRGTSKVCLSFGGSEPSLEGYTNSDMAGDLDCRKSTLGAYLHLQGELYHGSQSYKSAFHYVL